MTDNEDAPSPKGPRPIVERRRRLVVVFDHTDECHKAMHYAALRAAHTVGGPMDSLAKPS